MEIGAIPAGHSFLYLFTGSRGSVCLLLIAFIKSTGSTAGGYKQANASKGDKKVSQDNGLDVMN